MKKENLLQISIWIIGTAAVCIFIYLGFRYLRPILNSICYFIHLLQPLFLGVFFALILNIPMSWIERWLLKKIKNHKRKKAIRALSILYSLIFILGIFTGVSVFILPELIKALELLAQMLLSLLEALEHPKNITFLSRLPFYEFLSQTGIDWKEIKEQLIQRFSLESSMIVHWILNVIVCATGKLITCLIGLIFSIYILAEKEILKSQFYRFVRTWLPKRFSHGILHIFHVSIHTFHDFIAGQAIESIILGTLCIIGMMILRLPYAPMISALVGITAFIPIVGSFIGIIIGSAMILTVSSFQSLLFLIFLLLLQQIEGSFIYPRVVGAKINLPAIWVFAAVTVGANLAGPIGMFLGVPVMSVLYTLLREATRKHNTFL